MEHVFDYTAIVIKPKDSLKQVLAFMLLCVQIEEITHLQAFPFQRKLAHVNSKTNVLDTSLFCWLL